MAECEDASGRIAGGAEGLAELARVSAGFTYRPGSVWHIEIRNPYSSSHN